MICASGLRRVARKFEIPDGSKVRFVYTDAKPDGRDYTEVNRGLTDWHWRVAGATKWRWFYLPGTFYPEAALDPNMEMMTEVTGYCWIEVKQ